MSDETILRSSENNENGHSIKYVGDVGGLLPIVLLNLLFTILTLGIYRFWAKTNVRRYLWRHTKFDEESFEYTGTGGELFIGALIVFVIIIPVFFGISFGLGFIGVAYPLLAPFLILALYPIIFFLMGIAIYRAQVYRMSRTNWRGIRGAQLPGSAAYGWLTLKYVILYIISFGFMTPYIICRMWSFMMNNKRLGSGVFKTEVSSKPLFKVWIISWIIALVTLGGLGGLMLYATQTNQMGIFFVGYIASILAMLVLFMWFQAFLLNHLLNSLSFQNMKVNFRVTVKELLIFSLVNFVIILFTLGIGYPFITQRWIRFISERTTFDGQLDFTQISQSPEIGPHFGEGLAEAFDIG